MSAHATTMRGFTLKLTICLVRGECHGGGDQAEKGNDLESLHGGLFVLLGLFLFVIRQAAMAFSSQ